MDSSSPMSSPRRAGPARTNSPRQPPQKPYSKPKTLVKEDLCLAKAPCAAPDSTLDSARGSRSPSLKPTSKGPGEITMDLSLDALDNSMSGTGTQIWYCCACSSSGNTRAYAGPYIEAMYASCIHCNHRICSKCPRDATQ